MNDSRIHNTDDHLRNHGFFIDEQGIQLSPAYDINPSVNRNELSLAIDETETTCDVSVAMNAYKSYGISTARANEALQAVDAAVSGGEKKQTDSVFQKRRRLLWRKLLSNEELTMRRCKPGNALSTSSTNPWVDNRHNLFDRKRWGVPSGRAPTTHVLKMPVFCDKSFH